MYFITFLAAAAAAAVAMYRGRLHHRQRLPDRRKLAATDRAISRTVSASFCNPSVGRYSLSFALGFKKGNRSLTNS